jgi:hypothetical protein
MKKMNLAKYVLWGLSAISVVLFVILFTSIENETNPGARAERFISLNINWAVFLTVIASVIALGFAIAQTIVDKKKTISSLAVLAGFALIIIISYVSSSNQIPQFFGVEKFVADGTLTPSISRWIGTGLVTTYILFAAALLSILVFSAANLFKRS